MTKCPRCQKEPATIHPFYGVLPGVKCQAKDAKGVRVMRGPEFYAHTKAYRIQSQRDRFAKDLLQPYEGKGPSRDFVKAYPDKATDYFKKDELTKL